MTEFYKEVLSLRNILPKKQAGEAVSDDELFTLFDAVADKLFATDTDRKEQLSALMYTGKVTMGTSILTNINSHQSLNACTVLESDLRQDFNKIKQQIEDSSMAGMGVGFALDKMENPKEELYRLNKVLLKVNQQCRRPVAGITNLDVSHPKSLDYITSKREVDFGKFKFNISVSIGDDFMHRIIHSSASEKEKHIFSALAENMHYSGEPGVLFLERMQKQNPVPKIKFESFSPCAELPMGKGEACQFSYINLGKMVCKDQQGKTNVNWSAIAFASQILTRALDEAVQISIDNSVFDASILKAKRRIGVGICGYADLLITLGIRYGSNKGNLLLQDILTLINFSSKQESMSLAKEKGAFSEFANSQYVTDPEFLMRFAHQGAVSRDKWEKLNHDILKYGLRNSSTVALPPTGNSALLVGASNSIEPYFSLNNPFTQKPHTVIIDFLHHQNQLTTAEKAQIVTAITHEQLNDLFTKENELLSLFRTATAITPEEHLSVVIAAQACIDDAISKTINLKNTVSVAKIKSLLIQGYKGGVKGITVFREGCLSERTHYKKGDVVTANTTLISL